MFVADAIKIAFFDGSLQFVPFSGISSRTHTLSSSFLFGNDDNNNNNRTEQKLGIKCGFFHENDDNSMAPLRLTSKLKDEEKNVNPLPYIITMHLPDRCLANGILMSCFTVAFDSSDPFQCEFKQNIGNYAHFECISCDGFFVTWNGTIRCVARSSLSLIVLQSETLAMESGLLVNAFAVISFCCHSSPQYSKSILFEQHRLPLHSRLTLIELRTNIGISRNQSLDSQASRHSFAVDSTFFTNK